MQENIILKINPYRLSEIGWFQWQLWYKSKEHGEWDAPSKMLICQQQLIIEYLNWFQMNSKS